MRKTASGWLVAATNCLASPARVGNIFWAAFGAAVVVLSGRFIERLDDGVYAGIAGMVGLGMGILLMSALNAVGSKAPPDKQVEAKDRADSVDAEKKTDTPDVSKRIG